MENKTKKALLVFAVLCSIAFVEDANAINWLMLQGVTKEPYPLVWGFLQPAFFKTSGTTLSAGPWQGEQALSNTIQPDLSSSQVMQIQRARIGIRGAVAEDDAISYFLLAEYGNNGITQPGGGAGKATLTDATVTFTQIHGAKIRIGQMKVPMSEEIYQGIMTFNYINLTNIANQQLIERPFWTDGNAPCRINSNPTAPAPLQGPSDPLYLQYCNGDSQTQFRSDAVAARDIGIQIFDSFRQGDWEHSYALLIGQGGANKDDRDTSLDNTLYLSSEKIFGGQKVMRKGLKLYAWRTAGKRTIYDSTTLSAGGTSLEAAKRKYDRKLMGVGTTYFDGKYRFWAEYIKVDGMIFNSSTGGAVPGSVNSQGPMTGFPFAPGTIVSQFITDPDGKGDGGYLDFGYRVKPKIELDVRYDWYNRVTNKTAADKREFKTWTLGAQYIFNTSTKAMINYEIRDVNAPGLPSSDTVNRIANDTDNRLSAQIYLRF